MDELSYVKFNYTVNGDEVEIDDGEEIKLVVSIAEVNARVAELNEALASANNTINAQKDELNALASYRDAFEQAEAERVAREHEAAVAEMRQYCVDSGRFTNEELDGEELSALIENLDKASINTMIAERLIAEMRNQKPEPEVATVSGVKVTLEAEEKSDDKVAKFRSFLAN